MEIRAKCIFDFDSVSALSRLSMYRRLKPKRGFIIIASFSQFSLLASLILVHSRSLAVISLAILLFISFMHFAYPRIQFRALKKLQYMENEYIFLDDHIEVLSKSAEYTGTAELKYSLIPKAAENSRYFFIYQSGNAVFIVDKTTIIGGSAADIRDKLLSHVGKNYMLCKY